MRETSDYPFSVTAEHIAQLAERPLGQCLFAPSQLFEEIVRNVAKVLADAQSADLNRHFASTEIDGMVSKGDDLICAIRLVCQGILNVADPPPTPVLGPDVNNLRPLVTTLSGLLAQLP